MSHTALALAHFVKAHQSLTFVYYTFVGWPYLLTAYLLGSIPFGLVLGRVFFKTDIRTSGSGNIGAANAMRTYGSAAGLAVLVLDAAKGAIAVLLTVHLVYLPFSPPLLPHQPYQFGDTPISLVHALAPLAALWAVVGHCYSPWLGLRGGKGVATFLGTLIAFASFASLTSAGIFLLTWVVVVALSRFASLGSMLATAAVTIYVVVRNFSVGDGNCAIVFVVVALAIVMLKHADNLQRMRAGTENRLDFGKT